MANGPSTTAATGPLPVPSVSLVKVAEFDTPVELTTRPGDARSFVVEQGGRVLAFDDLSTEVVLDITDRTAANGERGLLGAAFDPAADRAYVHYSDESGDTVLAEYAIDPVTAIFDIESRREVLTVEQPFGNHNGGELAFGPDGYLYLALGDGGAADDPERNSLALSSRLGKILRIDPKPTANTSFATPQDNPFVDVDGADPTIWSLGLRNPWKFSFDSLTGDCGLPMLDKVILKRSTMRQLSAAKEQARDCRSDGARSRDQHGSTRTRTMLAILARSSNTLTKTVTVPLAVARFTAVTSIEDLFGWYVFGDFCSGRIWGYDPTSNRANHSSLSLLNLPASQPLQSAAKANSLP